MATHNPLITLGHFVERTQYKITPDLLFKIQRHNCCLGATLYAVFHYTFMTVKMFCRQCFKFFLFLLCFISKEITEEKQQLKLIYSVGSNSSLILIQQHYVEGVYSKIGKDNDWFMNFWYQH